MKVNIIPENCIACGLCYLHAPEVFDYHDNGIVKFNNSDKLEKEYISDDK
ncbi:MAG: ferredoxin, partial [Lactococcus sp.]|nr:ferredoxin [Lactococcus sp.]